MIKADPIIQSSGGLTLVRRVVFMLRGLCQVLAGVRIWAGVGVGVGVGVG